jgi:hypothetical protein
MIYNDIKNFIEDKLTNYDKQVIHVFVEDAERYVFMYYYLNENLKVILKLKVQSESESILVEVYDTKDMKFCYNISYLDI